MIGLGFATSACARQAPPDSGVGNRTVALYQALLRRPKGLWQQSKAEWLLNELDRYRQHESYGYPFLIKAEEVPRYVALRAIQLQTGSAFPLLPTEKRALARYPASVRRRWNPLARRLWLEASYDAGSNLATVRSEIAILRRLGMDMDALEAVMIGRERLNSKNGYQIAEEILRFSEAHPRDVVAAKSATLVLYVPTFLAVDRKQPLRKDLLDRVFALEARTIRNQNALLNDDQKNLKTFDILRDTMNGKYARRN